MSKTTKTILIVLGVILLCCCLVSTGGFLLLQRGLSQLSSGELLETDPLQLEQVSEEIADYTLPAGYTEEYSMDFFGFFKGLFITNQSKGVMISIIQINSGVFTSMEGYQESFQESFMKQYQMDNVNLDLVGERTVVIRGEETSVQVFEGSDTDGYDYIQWLTTFEGKNGTLIVVIFGNARTWDDAEMESFLNSIE